ncbi:hypothetical protein FNV43_RR21725 [Rhamnella rubrinervis]|uniref:Uncharacterized protein n=1 Tax=Rhamnella rubrinervis TaxID=2594499 RepID=A0A8K0DVP2_9ROSA|nr:hypothetical protein FNV43_RR21725 [Rhamnella rubrinervis]
MNWRITSANGTPHLIRCLKKNNSEEDYKKEREEMLKFDEADFDIDEDEDPEIPPYYYTDEFYEDSSSEE